MSERESNVLESLVVADDQPLLGVTDTRNGRRDVHYFTERGAERAERDAVTQRALAAIGSWRDLDWDDVQEALHLIRHRSPPTPPIDLDV